MRATKRHSKSSARAQKAIDSRNQLKQWLEKHIPDADLDQEKYSNGMLLVKILNNMFPGLINVEQIKEPTCLTMKVKMWKYLNELALVNLGIRLEEWELLKIARGTQNCIEKLLRKLMEVDNKKIPLKSACPPPVLPKLLRCSTGRVEPIPPSEPVEDRYQMPKKESVKIKAGDDPSAFLSHEKKITKYVEQLEIDMEIEDLMRRIEALSF